MVFHISNYMRETNVWMIRKMRWMLWGFTLTVPVYRCWYWDFHSRRVAWKSWFDRRSEKQKAEDAKAQKGRWGYTPRYEPKYDFSIKQRRYDLQNKSQRVRDTPRLCTTLNVQDRRGLAKPEDIRSLTYITREHNRDPGAFDYSYEQDFYSIYPDIDFDAFVTIGSKQRKGVDDLLYHTTNDDGM
mmetsp:Transcript_13422/g.15072  ORF Transcript_13422/g.15072 Transcript_13422/m.15072 type:complete len:185 (+) Transcript_13422:26-580(+)